MFGMAEKKKKTSEDASGESKEVTYSNKIIVKNSIQSSTPRLGEDKAKPKSLKKDLLDTKQLSNIIQSQDIDLMLDYLKRTKHVNKQKVMNLDPYFLDSHVEGVEMFMKMAIKLEPKNPFHHYNYALFLEIQKLYNKAKKEFETAIKLDKNNDDFRRDYANLLFLLKDYDAAEKEYKAAAEINPNDAHIWTNLGILYTTKNDPEKAESALKKAININPNYPLSYLNLLQLYRRLDMAAEARSLYQKYKDLEVQDLGINILHLDQRRDEKKNED